jgi:dihydroflavonol-4-reductase
MLKQVLDGSLRAMTNPAAKGQRFLALAGGITSLPEIAILLKSRLGERAKRVSTRRLPDWLVRLAAQKQRRDDPCYG